MNRMRFNALMSGVALLAVFVAGCNLTACRVATILHAHWGFYLDKDLEDLHE